MNAPMTIICLGDSITGASDLSKFMKWPHILDAMIEAACGHGRARVLNRGIAGNTSANMLARLGKDVLLEKPDLVILLAGGNDAGGDVPRTVTATNLDTIAGKVTGLGARLLGLRYHLIEHPDHADAAWRHLPTNNDLLEAAVLGHGGQIADTAASMTAARSNMSANELTAPDAVHLNPGGELVMARSVFQALRTLNWLPPV